MSWTRGRPTTNRRAGPTAIATFIASVIGVATGRGDRADAGHRRLHRERARGRAAAVVAIDPAGDRVTGEVDDVAAEAIELGDDRADDIAEDRGEGLGAALRAQLGGEGLGQWREARDVGEQPCAAHPVRHSRAGCQRPPTVPRDVGLRVVEARSVSGVRQGVDHAAFCPPGQRRRRRPGWTGRSAADQPLVKLTCELQGALIGDRDDEPADVGRDDVEVGQRERDRAGDLDRPVDQPGLGRDRDRFRHAVERQVARQRQVGRGTVDGARRDLDRAA